MKQPARRTEPLEKQRAQLCRVQRHDATVDAAVSRRGADAESALAVLTDLQQKQGFLPRETLGAVADALNLADAHVHGLATFYSMLSTRPQARRVVRICDGPVCMLHGAPHMRNAMENALEADGAWTIERTSCLGLCDCAPAALVESEPCGPLSSEAVSQVVGGWRGCAPSYGRPLPGEVRVAMERIGKVDPESIASAVEAGAYGVLRGALSRPPEQVLAAVEASGLCGLGGAGFPTGRKWRMVAQSHATRKYVVCNADESEPGAFKDRVLMEGDPHLLLEAMALAAYAVGAETGIIYVRGEYELSARRLEQAIAQAVGQGLLGEAMCGTEFAFQMEIHRGAGAYVCGEETALLESLEGRRGEPRARPPYPTTHGYHAYPTVVNNVETLCHVPAIVGRGAAWYHTLAGSVSPGTKIFTLTGHTAWCGAFEAPLGISLREVIEQFGKGMRSGSRFKMALTGGAAGTIVPAALLDVPLDFDAHKKGVALGSGVVVVFDESVSAVELLVWLLRFFEAESCGKCTPCRQGTYAARQIVERIAGGGGCPRDRAELRRLAIMLHATSLCGLGQSVAWPIESALTNFADDFEQCGAG